MLFEVLGAPRFVLQEVAVKVDLPIEAVEKMSVQE